MLKVGDQVRIRKDLIIDENYDGCTFVEEMGDFRGSIATIKKIKQHETYDLDCDGGEWAWVGKMFELPSERKTFCTGAVRDIDRSKGRCDLVPLKLLFEIMGSGEETDDPMGDFENVRDNLKLGNLDDARNDLIRLFCGMLEDGEPMVKVALDLSIRFRIGAEIYGVDNWKKGLPMSSYLNSAIRHYLKYLNKQEDEDHRTAYLWNILCLVWTIDEMPSMNDYKE